MRRFNHRTHCCYAAVVLGKDYLDQDCSIARALEVIGERWTLLIVRDAFFGVRRFSELRGHLDIPRAVLATRLNGLVENRILERRPDPEHAGRHLYELTADGRALWPVLYSLLIWGEHRHPNSRVFRHASCGTLLDDHGACSVCELRPQPEDIVTEPRRRRFKRKDPVTEALRRPHRLLEPLEVSERAPEERAIADPRAAARAV
jgi:DNA-binding HxlR family transcriptional regulator